MIWAVMMAPIGSLKHIPASEINKAPRCLNLRSVSYERLSTWEGVTNEREK